VDRRINSVLLGWGVSEWKGNGLTSLFGERLPTLGNVFLACSRRDIFSFAFISFRADKHPTQSDLKESVLAVQFPSDLLASLLFKKHLRSIRLPALRAPGPTHAFSMLLSQMHKSRIRKNEIFLQPNLTYTNGTRTSHTNPNPYVVGLPTGGALHREHQ